MDIVSTKKTNTIVTKETNILSAALINYHSIVENVIDCYILHAVVLMIIVVVCYFMWNKKVQYKTENNEF